MSFIDRYSIIKECKEITMQSRFYDINSVIEHYKHGSINDKILIKTFTAFCKTTNRKRLQSELTLAEVKESAKMIYETLIL